MNFGHANHQKLYPSSASDARTTALGGHLDDQGFTVSGGTVLALLVMIKSHGHLVTFRLKSNLN